ncbi:LuxR C-terminal-related transcriptional regulator [Sinorhizobium medicae]|uniref:LuxR C-terminal-related transcriptional regulator n=1 Tax=Sinorhizobium medicae TaxID=110321 RepID=UPI001AAF80A3|nr:response regulator transcription factor [Sinorhizobium medicae]MBO1960889.1 response regulator transcription factor [Sinorhizobium medicae]WQP41437.1 response regulator transcription factor [Sinorhizobium medicae]
MASDMIGENEINHDRIDLIVAARDSAGATDNHERLLVIIDSRALDRQCLAQSIIAHNMDMQVLALGTMVDWGQHRNNYPAPSAILLNVGARRIAEPFITAEIRELSSEFATTPVIVLADTDELAQVVKALEYGAKGYIPSSVSIDVCIEAIGLALAGGIFVPASSILAMGRLLETGNAVAHPLAGMFTARQAEVVEALRRGKANKIIAYELNLRESTVKVHIRNIMKKVKATNRTEVAFKINDLFPADTPVDGTNWLDP